MRETELIKAIGEAGLRIFSLDDIKKMAEILGISDSYLGKLTHILVKRGIFRKLYRGTYALPNSLLFGAPLHEYEMMNAISSPSALCCWSAMYYHKMTDQVLKTVYMMVPYGKTNKNTSKYQYEIEGTQFTVIRVQPENFFGIEKKFIGDSVFYVTDYERTLIDGLIRPQYCGGFFEVMHAFEEAQEKINIDKLMNYAQKCGKSVCKRLGWVLSELDIFKEAQITLQKIPCSSAYPIDVSLSIKTGVWIKEWNLIRNW